MRLLLTLVISLCWLLLGEAADGADEVLWQRIHYPQTGVTEDYPRGESARMVTTTPQIVGDVLTLAAVGPLFDQTGSWKDGRPQEGSLAIGAASMGWSAAVNGFGEMTSHTVNTGAISGNALTTSFSPLGLPRGASGLVNATVGNTFNASGWTSSLTRNGHTETRKLSSKGDLLGTTGYGSPDATWSAPSFGSTITKTLSTGAGSAEFTSNLAGTLKERKFPDGSGETFGYNSAGATIWRRKRLLELGSR